MAQTEKPANFALTDEQKRFIHKYIENQRLPVSEISVKQWESIAEKVHLQPQFGQIVKAAYENYVKTMRMRFKALRDASAKENQDSNASSSTSPSGINGSSQAAAKNPNKAATTAQRKSQNTTRMASADKTTSSAGKAQRAAKSNEPDPDDLSYLQTQAPNKGDDDDEEETDGGASATDDMDTAATDGEDEKQQVEPPTPVQAKSKSVEAEEDDEKSPRRKRRRKRRSKTRNKPESENSASDHMKDWLSGKKLEVLGMKKNFPRGIIWKVVDRDTGEESWVENRFLKYFYPDVLFEFYEDRLVLD